MRTWFFSIAALACTLGLTSLVPRSAAAPRLLTAAELQNAHGAGTTGPVNPVVTCVIPATSNCPAYSSCKKTACDVLGTTCPGAPFNVIEANAVSPYANATNSGDPGRSNTKNLDEIFCATENICQGCVSVIGINYCKSNGASSDPPKNVDSRIPTEPDPASAACPAPAQPPAPIPPT
jgi:hypothetical protein